MRYLLLTSIYYIWICVYSLIIADNIYLDATYFIIEDMFGILLVSFLMLGKLPNSSLEIIAGWGIVMYKGMAIVSEVLMFWGIFIPPELWAAFAITALLLNGLTWWILTR